MPSAPDALHTPITTGLLGSGAVGADPSSFLGGGVGMLLDAVLVRGGGGRGGCGLLAGAYAPKSANAHQHAMLTAICPPAPGMRPVGAGGLGTPDMAVMAQASR